MRTSFFPLLTAALIHGIDGGAGGATAPVTPQSVIPPTAPTPPNPPAAPAAAQVQTPPAVPAPAPPAEQTPREPSVMERVQSILRPRSAMQAEANDYKAQAAELVTERDALKVRCETAEASVLEYETALQKLEAAKVTVSQGVTDQLSQLGIPEENLPPAQGAAGADGSETLESIEMKLSQESDPIKRSALAAKQVALLGL